MFVQPCHLLLQLQQKFVPKPLKAKSLKSQVLTGNDAMVKQIKENQVHLDKQ